MNSSSIITKFSRILFYSFMVYLLVFICLQSFFPVIERMLFWGEGLCVLIFFGIFNVSYQIALQRKIILLIYFWIFLFSIISLFLTFFFWREEIVNYYVMRQLSLFYYALFFFAGYKWGDLLLVWLGKFWVPLFIFTLVKIFIIKGWSTCFVTWFGLLWMSNLKQYNQKSFFWYGCVFMIIMFYLAASGTDKSIAYFIVLSPLLILFLKLWRGFDPKTGGGFDPKTVIVIIVPIALVITVFVVVSQGRTLETLTSKMLNSGLSIENLPLFVPTTTNELDPLKDFFDYNAWWRFAFWSYLLQRFIEHPIIGIGLGTPIFDFQMANFLHMPMEPGDEYAIPAHNGFITLMVRLGIPFLLFFCFLFFYCFRLFFCYLVLVNFKPLKDIKSRIVFVSFLIFGAVLIQASLNGIVESPLYAWFVWLIFGLFVRLCGDDIAERSEDLPIDSGLEIH